MCVVVTLAASTLRFFSSRGGVVVGVLLGALFKLSFFEDVDSTL